MSQAEKHPTCETCRFWKKDEDNRPMAGHGFCHRFPPAISFQIRNNDPDDVYPWGYWPSVAQDNWCGEHQEAGHVR